MSDRDTELVIEDETGNRQVVPLPTDEITVGRDAASTVWLAERNVSRRHARLVRDGDGFLVEDLGSSNGVFLNGERVAGRHPLARGDRIRIGDFELWLRPAKPGDDSTVPEVGVPRAPGYLAAAVARRDTVPSTGPATRATPHRPLAWPWVVAVIAGLGVGVVLGIWGQRSLAPPATLPADSVMPLAPLVPAEAAADSGDATPPAPAPVVEPAGAARPAGAPALVAKPTPPAGSPPARAAAAAEPSPRPPAAIPRRTPPEGVAAIPPQAPSATPQAAPAATPPRTPPEGVADGVGAAYAEAVALLKAGEVTTALAALDRCLALEPGRAPCWRALGIARARAGDTAAAAAAYRRYLELDPQAPDAARVRELLSGYDSP